MQFDKIYFDLDGVMANFEQALVREIQVHYWDRATEKFWNRIEHIPNFFYGLEVMPGSLEMFHMVMDKHGTDIVEVLTAGPMPTKELATAAADKARWVKDNMHPEIVVNCVQGGKNKYKFLEQNPGALLIDDYKRNIDQWIAAGGVGILHTDPPSTIEKLKILGVL